MAQYAPTGNYGFTYIPVPTAGDERDVGRWLVDGAHPGLAGARPGRGGSSSTSPDRKARPCTRKETTHLPTLNALLEDASLFDASHKRSSSTSCDGAKSRPPLAVGRALLGCADQRTGFGRAEHQGAAGRAPGGRGRRPAAAGCRRLLTTVATTRSRGPAPVPAHVRLRRRGRGDEMAVAPRRRSSRHAPGARRRLGSDRAPQPANGACCSSARGCSASSSSGVFPILYTFYLSLTRYSGIRDPIFIGTQNYERMVDRPAVLEGGLQHALLHAAGRPDRGRRRDGPRAGDEPEGPRGRGLPGGLLPALDPARLRHLVHLRRPAQPRIRAGQLACCPPSDCRRPTGSATRPTRSSRSC